MIIIILIVNYIVHDANIKQKFYIASDALKIFKFFCRSCIFVYMTRIQYTGTNFDEVKELCGGKVLAPYFCMGFSMLSLETKDGYVTVNEGDTIVMDDNGEYTVER